jgi:hypothetical protein
MQKYQQMKINQQQISAQKSTAHGHFYGIKKGS